MNEKMKNGLLGMVIGDAMGVPFEFRSRKEINKKNIALMIGYGTHFQVSGTWSDDSSMAFCIMDSILKNDGYNASHLADTFVKWMNEGYLTPHGKVFDIGISTSKSLKNYAYWKDFKTSGLTEEKDNGNGALMRILPFIYYVKNFPIEKRFDFIKEESGITHNHAISHIGCFYYSEFIINLLNGLSKKEAYFKTAETVLNFFENHEYNNYLSYYKRLLEGKIWREKATNIRGNGFIVSTLEASIWSFMRNKSFISCLENVIALGEDTDTTGCVTGGIAGVYFPEKQISEEYINVLANKNKVLELIKNYVSYIEKK